MHRRRLLFAFAAIASLTSFVSAATLHVPQEYDRIQRAIFAAEPGDTIAIAEGTFHENLLIPHGVTLRGSGVGKTIIVGPDRQSSVIAGEGPGAIALADLTLQCAPPMPGVAERDKYPHALKVSYAPLVLRNVRLEQLAFYGIHCEGNLVTFDNVHVVPLSNNPVKLEHTLPGTKIKGLTIEPLTYGEQVAVVWGAADFEDLNPGLGEHASLRVEGASAVVRFGNLPPPLLARVTWAAEAKPDGVGAQPLANANDWIHKQVVGSRRIFDDYIGASKTAQATRRKLARELNAHLASAANADAALGALGVYLPQLYATRVDPKHDEPGRDEQLLDHAVCAELRSLVARFGPPALEDALRKLPSRFDGSKLAERATTTLLAPDVKHVLALLAAEKWVQANFADLPTLLGTWKKEPASDAVAAGKAFAAALESLSEKTKSTEPAVKIALRERAIAAFRELASQRGALALDHVLRHFDAPDTSAIAPEHLRAALTPEHRLALARLWKGTQ